MKGSLGLLDSLLINSTCWKQKLEDKLSQIQYIYGHCYMAINGTSDDYNIQVLIYNKNTTKFWLSTYDYFHIILFISSSSSCLWLRKLEDVIFLQYIKIECYLKVQKVCNNSWYLYYNLVTEDHLPIYYCKLPIVTKRKPIGLPLNYAFHLLSSQK